MAVYAITLAFCNPGILRRSIEAFYRTRSSDLEIEHYIVDQHYPLYRDDTLKTLDYLEKRFHVKRLDPGRNLGLHVGFNWALRWLHDITYSDDIIIGYDGDSLPTTPGWDKALIRTLTHRNFHGGDTAVWASLANPRTISDVHARGFDYDEVPPGSDDGRLPIWKTRTPITNSICAWRYGWLESVGYLTEPRAFYGHLESAMWDRLRPGERWAVLPGCGESDELRRLHDREYTAYKWHHSHTQAWPGDFESFVSAGCPGLDSAPLEIP